MRRALAIASAAAALGAALAAGAQAASAAVGTLSVCNAGGNPPVATVVTFQLVAPASEGGTQIVTLAAGACSANYFFTQGLQVTVIESVPTGGAVTNIAIKGESTIAQKSFASGLAVVTIGNADSVLTFTTQAGGTPALKPCVVPRVVGLTLATARKAITRAACRVKGVSYVYSTRIPKGGVTSSKPRAGARLAHNGPVRLVVSKGRKP